MALEASREGKVSMGADTRLSAVSARLPHTLHIWLYHGSSRRRSSSDECVALRRRTARTELHRVIDNTRH